MRAVTPLDRLASSVGRSNSVAVASFNRFGALAATFTCSRAIAGDRVLSIIVCGVSGDVVASARLNLASRLPDIFEVLSTAFSECTKSAPSEADEVLGFVMEAICGVLSCDSGRDCCTGTPGVACVSMVIGSARTLSGSAFAAERLVLDCVGLDARALPCALIVCDVLKERLRDSNDPNSRVGFASIGGLAVLF